MTQQLGIFDPPPVKAYYPTTAPTAKQLAQRTAKANGQNSLILAFFQANPGHGFTAWQVSKEFTQWPLTSIRRALHTLEKDDRLVRTGEQREGGYGHENFVYQLKPQYK